MWYLIPIITALLVIAIIAVAATIMYSDYRKEIEAEEAYEEYNKEYAKNKDKLILKQYYRDLNLENTPKPEEYIITGIREPIGRWTQMITDQQSRSYITAIKMFMQDKFSSSGGKLGKWQLTLKAQSLASNQGKQRGRGKQ